MAAPKLGSGARFKALSATLAAHGAQDPKALAAAIGRKKLGKARMQRLASTGAKRAAPKPAAKKVIAPDTGGGEDRSGY